MRDGGTAGRRVAGVVRNPPSLRLAVYLWTSPTTLLGLALAALALPGGRWRRADGVLEASGGWLPRLLRLAPIGGGAAAVALGHVVLAQDQAALDRTRAHERVHVRQAERWGPLFVPAYLLVAGWLLVRRRDPYLEHPFEIEARRGGERAAPPPRTRSG